MDDAGLDVVGAGGGGGGASVVVGGGGEGGGGGGASVVGCGAASVVVGGGGGGASVVGGGTGASVVIGGGGGGASVVAGGAGASVVVDGGGGTNGVEVDEGSCVAGGVDLFLAGFLVWGFGVYTAAGFSSGDDGGVVRAPPASTHTVLVAYSTSITSAVVVSHTTARLWL